MNDMESQQSFEIWKKQMRFAAKRGNLETELLLVKFINQLQFYPQEDRQHLQQLLAQSDQDLFCWLLQASEHVDPACDDSIPAQFRSLIQQIKTVYLS
ncbi:succinate dehydrogenase assembly factor 2 [Thiomicrorhabdus xiamenensis]|uniref:FAD assembly factor SdhE n=1 Tax=Thiomicrorhabdus xiamenensis TaxID=2739063 RepID=A0A7D4SYJ0_9GAMM|nr:succinate dehydrogenase assembly factor 2 [Thiomicrorhabdus xiamenensis]QKI89084.1 succinate dehydrogenase assembly factor 2 [Thiomicrorhabdus xiamenensis]